MNTRCAWLAFLLLAPGMARAYDATISPAQWKSDKSEIRRGLDASVQAFDRGDLPGHFAIHDEDVDFMTKDGPRRGIAPIEKTFR